MNRIVIVIMMCTTLAAMDQQQQQAPEKSAQTTKTDEQKTETTQQQQQTAPRDLSKYKRASARLKSNKALTATLTKEQIDILKNMGSQQPADSQNIKK